MRRSDRQLTLKEDIIKILDTCKVCRIAMVDGNKPYIVPMSYGYEYPGDILSLYFHCAKEGRKIDILKANQHVCFELDYGFELIEADTACNYSNSYVSLIGSGTVEFIEGYEKKGSALDKLMKTQTGKEGFTYSEKAVEQVIVFKITTKDFTAKSIPKK